MGMRTGARLAAVLERIEALGYSTSMNREAGGCELLAVKLPTGQPAYSVRVDGDSDEDVDAAARELARMVGVDPEAGARGR